LLRHVFETCATFDDAKVKLETTPVARPVIYTLAGCERGERCVIERTEDTHLTRTEDTSAANDWLVARPSWEARVGGKQLFATSVTGNSVIRRAALADWTAPFGNGFDWVTPPVLNPFTRLAVEMCAAQGVLRVVGYETVAGADLPQAVTSARDVRHEFARVAIAS
jgi:hypothetical protein